MSTNRLPPDHRNVGVLVAGRGLHVTVPFFCPGILPTCARNPVFLYFGGPLHQANRFSATWSWPSTTRSTRSWPAWRRCTRSSTRRLQRRARIWFPTPQCRRGRRSRKEVRDGVRPALRRHGESASTPAGELYGVEGAKKSSTPRPSRCASTAGCRRRGAAQAVPVFPVRPSNRRASPMNASKPLLEKVLASSSALWC